MPLQHTFTLVHVPPDTDARLCKVHSPQGTADIDDLPYFCLFEEVEAESIAALRRLLDELAGDSRTCILRARPLHAGPCRRIAQDQGGDAATLEDVPRAWVLIDLDSIACPEGIDFVLEPQRAALHIRNTLPTEFRNAACVWHASSNAGLKPGIRLHLWFLLTAPLDTDRLQYWLRNTTCDKAPMRANQPHFTADPVFMGVPDPMAKRRGTLQGSPRVAVPPEIEGYETPARPRAASTENDPLKGAALRAWEAANPFEEPSSSERIECPACGSSDGIAVREDRKWNCHGGKHVDNAPAIGTYTGSVYVGHRIEFQLKLTARDVIPYLKNHGFWPKIALSEKFTGRSRDSAENATSEKKDEQLGVDTAIATMSALVTGAAKPSIREYARANDALRKAKAVVMESPGKLADVAEECARWVPTFLDADQVKRTLRDAATRAPTAVALTSDVADQIILQAMQTGMARPHRTRAARREDEGPQLPLDEHGQPARSIATVYYFCTRPQIMNAIALDDRSHRVVVIEAPPWWLDDDREFPRALEPADLPRCAAFIADRFGFAHVGTKDLHKALLSVAQDRRWDPVEDYLDGLKWEGTDEEAREFLGAVPSTLLGAELGPYPAAVFMRWCIAAVQRTYEPGCMFREVMTLIGPQNVGKSQFLRTLCADPMWFSDTVAADGSQASRSGLDGKWIVEFAELDKHMHSDRTGAFKNFISTQVDSYRRAYAEVDQDMRRRCVFAATSNVDRLFVDPTGNTRFNVVEITTVDLEGTVEFREQIWAAARHLYQSGEKAYLQGAERVWAVERQAHHYNESTPEALIRELWETPAPAEARVRGGVEAGKKLGFDFEPAQLDAQRKWQALTTAQIRGYLHERGSKGNVDKTIQQTCKALGLEHGRLAAALGSVGRQRGWAQVGSDMLTK